MINLLTRNRLSFIFMVAVVAGVFCSTATAVHPFHVSVAEMEFDAETKKLEVALRVWPIDLEKVLRLKHQQAVDLDKTENVDELIVAYLLASFLVQKGDGDPIQIEWVGKEIDAKHAWLYFEIPVDDPADLLITNRVCFEAVPDQENTILFRHDSRQLSLRFTHDRAKAKLDLQKLR